MKLLFLVIALVSFGCTDSEAKQDQGSGGGSGDKVSNPWQPVDPDLDTCTAFLPAGIDVSDCIEVATSNSGKAYLCGTIEDYIVFCPED